MKRILVVLFALLVLVGCSSNEKPKEEEKKDTPKTETPVEKNEDKDVDYSKETNPIVTIVMESGEEITIELYPEVAPNTVNNFVTLINSGYYDGTTFHRVIPGFMVQGGDPDGNGTGGPGYSIKGEFTSNGFENNLKHTRGVLSMARTNVPDSAGSQFFIMVADSPHLDGEYASFGNVLTGMDVVDGLVGVDRDSSDKPLSDLVIKSISVDTKGIDYPAPETN